MRQRSQTSELARNGNFRALLPLFVEEAFSLHACQYPNTPKRHTLTAHAYRSTLERGIMRSIVPTILFFVFLAGCRGPTSNYLYGRPLLIDARIKLWDELEGHKAKLSRNGVQPQMQEIEGCGTMFVWNHSLGGGPSWEFLRASYSYKNTSDTKFDIVRVWLEVLDPDGKVVNRGEDVLMHPLGYALTPGDTWSDVMKVNTKGVHKKKGWSWRIGCEPVQMKVLPPKRFGG